MKRILLLAAAGVLLSAPLFAQVTKADYERAIGLREKYQALTVNVPEPATWIEKKPRFHYRRWIKGGNEHMLIDVETKEKRPAFDHARLAQTLNKLVRPKEDYTALKPALQHVQVRGRGEGNRVQRRGHHVAVHARGL